MRNRTPRYKSVTLKPNCSFWVLRRACPHKYESKIKQGSNALDSHLIEDMAQYKQSPNSTLGLASTLQWGIDGTAKVCTRGCKGSCPGSRTSSLTASALPPPPGLPLQLPLQLVLQPPSLLQQLAHQLPRLDKTMATMATTTMKVEWSEFKPSVHCFLLAQHAHCSCL